jgi:hypothetical protein
MPSNPIEFRPCREFFASGSQFHLRNKYYVSRDAINSPRVLSRPFPPYQAILVGVLDGIGRTPIDGLSSAGTFNFMGVHGGGREIQGLISTH